MAHPTSSWKTAQGLISESSQLAGCSRHRTGLLRNVLYMMLCRCVRVLTRRGGGGVNVRRTRAANTTNDSSHKRTSSALWPQRRPVAAPRAYSTIPINNCTRSNGREGLQLLPAGYRGVVLNQQQRRCLSAMPENEFQEVENSKGNRTEKVNEVIKDGIRELRVQLRSKSEEGSNGSRRVRRGDLFFPLEATVACSKAEETAGVVCECFGNFCL